jgi:hypothetical protein
LGERHLRELVQEFTAHYHAERYHQGLGNTPVAPMSDSPAAESGRVVRHQRLGGMLKYYYRDAPASMPRKAANSLAASGSSDSTARRRDTHHR